MVALAILVRFPGVGESSGHVILQLQNTNDLTAACSNSHHIENSELATLRESWLLPPFTRTRLNFIHFDTQSRNQDIWLPSKRFVVTPVYSRVFEILTTLTFGSTAQKSHCVTNIRVHHKKAQKFFVQQCFVKCQEHNRSKKGTLRGEKKGSDVRGGTTKNDICNRRQSTPQGMCPLRFK